MRLHEYYFENLGGKGGLDKSGKLAKNSQRASAVMKRGKRISREQER